MSTYTTKITPPLEPRILENLIKQSRLNHGLSSWSEHDYPRRHRNPPTISESSFIPLPSKIPRPTRTGGEFINKLFPSPSQSYISILSPFRNESNPFIVHKIPVCHENSILNIDKSPAFDPSFKNNNTKSRRPLQNLFINDTEQIVYSYLVISLTE